MKQNSYITIPRSLHESDEWNKLTGEQVKAYLDLCFRVTFKDMDIECKYGTVHVEKGQLVTTQDELGYMLGVTRSQLRTLLKTLEKRGLVMTKVLTKGFDKLTILSISELNTTLDQGTDSKLGQQFKEEVNNNLSNDKFLCVKTRAREKRFVKPSAEEVQQYLNEKGETRFTGQEFCDFYDSCGWVIGKNKFMKSWKGAVGTWIAKENKDDRNNKNNKNYGTKFISNDDREAAATALRRQKFGQHIIDQLSNNEPEEKRDLPF